MMPDIRDVIVLWAVVALLYGGWRLISWPWRRYQERKRGAAAAQILIDFLNEGDDPEDGKRIKGSTSIEYIGTDRHERAKHDAAINRAAELED